MNAQAALTEAVYYILLSLATPRHGYGIMQETERMSSGRVKLAAGTLYGAINGLLDKGWIRSVPGADDSRRKEYALTDKGREALTWELDAGAAGTAGAAGRKEEGGRLGYGSGHVHRPGRGCRYRRGHQEPGAVDAHRHVHVHGLGHSFRQPEEKEERTGRRRRSAAGIKQGGLANGNEKSHQMVLGMGLREGGALAQHHGPGGLGPAADRVLHLLFREDGARRVRRAPGVPQAGRGL